MCQIPKTANNLSLSNHQNEACDWLFEEKIWIRLLVRKCQIFETNAYQATFSLIPSMRDFIKFKQDLEHYLRIDSLNYQREHIEQQYRLIRRERIHTVCNIPHSKFNWLHNIRWPWIAKIISIDFIIPLSEFKNKILNICRLMRLTHSVWLVDDESYRNWIQSNRVAPAQFALVPELQYSQNKFSPCPSSYTNLYHNHI